MAATFLRLAVAYKLDDVRTFPEERSRTDEVILLPSRDRWLFVPNARNDDDGVDWLLPSWMSSDKDGRWGRWQIVASGGGGGGGDDSDDVTLPIAESDVTGLVDDLAAINTALGSAAILPIAESDVTGLVTDLASKATLPIAQADVSGLVSALAGKASTSHTHPESDITSLVSDLAGKAAASHTHPESDITSLAADLAAKEATANKGAANGYASLNSGTKVVEDPANATATPTASKIVIASAGGKVDSWVSDSDASTKGLVKLANDLGGTAALPKVVAITETSGPTQLVTGIINDGEFLKRVGGTLVSAPGGSGIDLAESLLLKSYFSDQGLLPSTTIKEMLKSLDTFDGVSGAGSVTYLSSRGKLTTATESYMRYNLSGSYTKILLIVGMLKTSTINYGIWYGNTLSSNVPTDGSMFMNEQNSSRSTLYKLNSFVAISPSPDTSVYTPPGGGVHFPMMAMHIDLTAHRIRCYYRFGAEMWWPVFDITDGTNIPLSSAQYVGTYLHAGPGWIGCPYAIYVD